ncbi:MAG: hypothetical protein EHM64_07760 [Ignavibacteriae bacterium]|nr:MAG: hypothetical protein EHM64_07760 [Ignavibacteriota bacterium]
MQSLRINRNIANVLIAAAMTLLFACDESLPPRNDPSDLFRGSINAKYSLLFTENALRLEVKIVNRYDETIQAPVSMSGVLHITLSRDSRYQKTIPLTAANLASTKAYNPSTKELTLNPGDSIKFVYTWNFIDDNNAFLPEEVFHYYLDTDCPGRFISFRESFVLTGSFQIIEKLGSIPLTPLVLNLCYISKYFTSHDCPAPPITCDDR